MKKILTIGSIFCVLGALTFITISNLRSYLQVRQQVLNHIVETKKTMVNQLPESFKKKITIASSSATYRVPILLYHYVEIVTDKKDKLRQDLTIVPAVFDEQVKTLADSGYTFMTAKELGEVLDGKTQMPSKPVLLTFDDGHWDMATDILPILKKYHAKATAYIVPGFTGGSDFMSESQVRTVSESGLVDIGAHTVHHISLKDRSYAVVKNEIDRSKTILQDTYHISVVSFAYPYGAFDEQSVQLVKAGGFTTAVSTVPGIEQNNANRFFLYRIRPGARTGKYLLSLLAQDHFKEY